MKLTFYSQVLGCFSFEDSTGKYHVETPPEKTIETLGKFTEDPHAMIRELFEEFYDLGEDGREVLERETGWCIHDCFEHLKEILEI